MACQKIHLINSRIICILSVPGGGREGSDEICCRSGDRFERVEEMHDEAEVCEVLFAHLLNGVRTY